MKLEEKLKAWSPGRYELGIITNTINELIAGTPMKVKMVKHRYKDRWFADPFVLDVTETEILLLVEEYYYPERKGRIALLHINRKSLRITSNTTVLTLDTHLSFPVIRREGSDVYVIPENGQLGKLVKYRFSREQNQLLPDRDLIDLPLADAVDLDMDGGKYLFCTICPDHSGSLLSIYKFDRDKYDLCQTYDFDGDKIARMAGDFFSYQGKLYRPCQDCNDRYGYGVLIQEVSRNGDRFDFRTVSRYTSPLKRWNLGLHTLNMYKGVIVTDFLGYTHHPFLTKCSGYAIGAIHRTKRLFGIKVD